MVTIQKNISIDLETHDILEKLQEQGHTISKLFRQLIFDYYYNYVDKDVGDNEDGNKLKKRK